MTTRVLFSLGNLSVLQWQDTELYGYPEPPSGMSLLDISREQFDSQVEPMWVVDGALTQTPPVFEIPGPTDAELAKTARDERGQLLSSICDPGVLMAQRALRMASTPEETAYAEGKISELDIYAEALLAIPDQAGFPQTIVWPEVPTK